MKTVFINILFLLFFPFIAWAADDAKPKGAETADTKTAETEAPATDHSMLRQEGEPKGFQPLIVVGKEIDATYLEETKGDSNGVIVFLHDQGEQFENKLITPLRQSLPEYGWSTLTLALDYPFEPKIYLSSPESDVAENKTDAKESEKPAEPEKKEQKAAEPAKTDQKVDESATEKVDAANAVLPPMSNVARVEAAIAFAQNKNIERIIFVSHGASGDLAIDVLENLATVVSALILIGVPELKNDQVFETLTFPVLDVIGSNEQDDIKAAALHRKKLMKQTGNINYALREVVGADHVFYGLLPQLTITLRSWLNKHFVEEVTEQ
jgi:hypothetical protein